MVSKVEVPDEAPSRAGSLALIAGALALDFANTSSGRGGPTHLDHLREPAHVVAWAEYAGVVDSGTAKRCAARLRAGDPSFGKLLQDALALREAIYGVATALAGTRTPPQRDLATIKAACARAIAAAELAPGPEGYRWRWPTDPPVPQTILGPVALSTAGLLRGGDLSRVKQCAGEQCGWLFFDLTKNKSRRWCEMSVCGNRAKARRFARRAK
jgi:predicted RNA-binding Zn ribbon-like protein